MARYRLRFLLQEFDLPRGATILGRSSDCHVTIEDPQPNLKNVTLIIKWRGGQRSARLSLMRADTGGSNLW